MTLLEQVKLLLGITGTDSDALLSLLCDTVSAQVISYCRAADLSDAGLQGAAADIAVNRYRARGYGNTERPKTVSGISEGDVSVSYKTDLYSASGVLTADECAALAPYRKLWL